MRNSYSVKKIDYVHMYVWTSIWPGRSLVLSELSLTKYMVDIPVHRY